MRSRRALAALAAILAVAPAVTRAGSSSAAEGTAPAYVVAEIRIHDPETYRGFAKGVGSILDRHGGRFLTIGGAVTPVEGAPPHGQIVILAFPSLERARAFLASPEHRALEPIRKRSAEARTYLVEGTVNSLLVRAP